MLIALVVLGCIIAYTLIVLFLLSIFRLNKDFDKALKKHDETEQDWRL
jgi:hypothetical protein